jgi:hypothetical protein
VEARQNIRQQAGNDALDDPEIDFAAPQAAQVVNSRAGAIEITENAMTVPRQHLASGGELNPGLGALEQHRVDLVLELRDLSADRRWRDVQPVRRLADRPQLGHLVEIAECQKTHGIPSRTWRRLAGTTNPARCSERGPGST